MRPAVRRADPRAFQGTLAGLVICGGNLISGFAHSRDLIYVSPLLQHYFTDEKIMETWARCEEYGINTMIFDPIDPHAINLCAIA